MDNIVHRDHVDRDVRVAGELGDDALTDELNQGLHDQIPREEPPRYFVVSAVLLCTLRCVSGVLWRSIAF